MDGQIQEQNHFPSYVQRETNKTKLKELKQLLKMKIISKTNYIYLMKNVKHKKDVSVFLVTNEDHEMFLEKPNKLPSSSLDDKRKNINKIESIQRTSSKLNST